MQIGITGRKLNVRIIATLVVLVFAAAAAIALYAGTMAFHPGAPPATAQGTIHVAGPTVAQHNRSEQGLSAQVVTISGEGLAAHNRSEEAWHPLVRRSGKSFVQSPAREKRAGLLHPGLHVRPVATTVAPVNAVEMATCSSDPNRRCR